MVYFEHVHIVLIKFFPHHIQKKKKEAREKKHRHTEVDIILFISSICVYNFFNYNPWQFSYDPISFIIIMIIIIIFVRTCRDMDWSAMIRTKMHSRILCGLRNITME